MATSVEVEGLLLVPRRPSGWKTECGRYEVIGLRRGSWEAYDLQHEAGRTCVARGGTRTSVVTRLLKVMDHSYTGSIPYEIG